MRNFLLVLLLASGFAAHAQTTLFRNVRLFDGERVGGPRDVLVRDGVIAAVSSKIEAPAGATVIDGTGKTLLPGFIDAHTHTWGDALRTALAFGVTTELDMFTGYSFVKAMKEEQAAGKANGRADLFSAGTLVTAPGGHGTEYGMTIPTITKAEEAQAFVDARIAEGSDYIKIVLDDGHTYGMKMPTVSAEVLKAVVDAAHARKKLAVVHVGDLAGARAAMNAGADALVHLFVDVQPDAAFGRDAAKRRMFVTPTLTVLMSVTGTSGGGTLANDARMTPYLTKPELAQLQQSFPRRPGQPPVHYSAAVASVKQLRAAKVPILAGTDAGNPGTAHGSALHRELELLVEAGLTPTEALVAATSAPARAFALADRGRVAKGLRADLLLVNGDPTTDITATRDIAGIWKGGVPFDRAAYAKSVATANAATGAKPAGLDSGAISDFNDGTMKAAFGAGWMLSTDAVAGGKSTGDLSVADGALVVRGTIVGPLPYAWSGAMFSPAAVPFQPADVSSKKAVRFRAKGDGKTYRVMLFTTSTGYTPLVKTFTGGADWTDHTFPIASFGNIDGRDLTAIIFAGGPEPGDFELRLDDVRLE
ncbi:MAG TPA: CIA30 family protein [Thermoanaerobaculia bacterium]|nr:CIA30 family protein [Thermoanaerobaculia bacterium]